MKGGELEKEKRNGLLAGDSIKEVSPAYILTDEDVEEIYKEREDDDSIKMRFVRERV